MQQTRLYPTELPYSDYCGLKDYEAKALEKLNSEKKLTIHSFLPFYGQIHASQIILNLCRHKFASAIVYHTSDTHKMGKATLLKKLTPLEWNSVLDDSETACPRIRMQKNHVISRRLKKLQGKNDTTTN